VAKNTLLSLFIALARALTDFERPTKSGATMCGKTTMSLNGNNGRTSVGTWASFSLKNLGKLIMALSLIFLLVNVSSAMLAFWSAQTIISDLPC
jgi:hypothetical protein